MPSRMRSMRKRMPRAGTKGAKSKTRPGDLDYTTKRGDKDFHRDHHDILSGRAPFKKVADHVKNMSRHY